VKLKNRVSNRQQGGTVRKEAVPCNLFKARASQDPKERLPASHTNWGCPPEERRMPFFLTQSKKTESGLFSMSKSVFKGGLFWAWWHSPVIPANQEVEKADHEFKASPGKVSSETLSQK
jgi:hypothetical protein